MEGPAIHFPGIQKEVHDPCTRNHSTPDFPWQVAAPGTLIPPPSGAAISVFPPISRYSDLELCLAHTLRASGSDSASVYFPISFYQTAPTRLHSATRCGTDAVPLRCVIRYSSLTNGKVRLVCPSEKRFVPQLLETRGAYIDAYPSPPSLR